jgi:arsenical-resistance protein 2
MAQEELPWYASLPTPTRTASLYPKEDLLRQFNILGDILNAGTLLIDVRRTDYEGGTIRGSLNIPAQSFFMNMATLYRLCQGDGVSVISRIMFYCGRCLLWCQSILLPLLINSACFRMFVLLHVPSLPI